MKELIFICKELLNNKSVLRAYLNWYLKEYEVDGKTIDIGGGGGSSTYLEHVKRGSAVEIINFDPKIGTPLDFEKDRLPVEDGFYDTVLFLNVMEHIFNHQHIANEVVRILKPEATLIGYVPFFMWYHPDHRDFFRYTHEALQIIFEKAGAKQIQIVPVGRGPFTVSSHVTTLLLPRVLRPVWFIPHFCLDALYNKFKRNKNMRYVLGYLFTLTK